MKKIKLFIILLLTANMSLFAQTTNIPDANFEQALIDLGYDDALDGAVLTANINTVTNLYLSHTSIEDLKGIENFTALTELSADYSSLKHLDVSKNTALTKLYCSYCNLTNLNIANGNNANLTSFNVAGNTNLSYIFVDNKNAIPLSWFKEATTIYIDATEYTYLPDANFEQALIDLSYDDVLDGAVLTANINTVTNLDISNKNISDLTGIEDFTTLTILHCDENQLTNLDVSANTALIVLYCNKNQLTSLDISKNMALRELICYENQLTNLEVSANTALSVLYCYQNQLTNLDVSKNADLIKLLCFNNQLTSLDISKNTALQELICDENQLTSLDISSNKALTFLACSYNQLTNLDVSSNTALTILGCSSNQLTNLDVSSNTALTILDCSFNQLTNLDVSSNTALKNLHCPVNQLTSLGISVNTALAYLNCSYNQLTSLDVSANTVLTKLFCENNELTSLDISSNTALNEFYCIENQLTCLDFRNGNNADITDFNAIGNPTLEYIMVDDAAASYLSAWSIDATTAFANSDPLAPVPDIETLATVESDTEVTVLTAPTATDNCSGSIIGTTTVSFPITESTTVVWTYEDGNGNTSTQNQEVIIGGIPLGIKTSETSQTQIYSYASVIYINLAYAEKSTISVFDLSGRNLKTLKASAQATQISDLQKGTYIVRVNTVKETKVEKVFVR